MNNIAWPSFLVGRGGFLCVFVIDYLRLNGSCDEYQFLMTLRLLMLDQARFDLVSRLEDHSNLLSEVQLVTQ